MSSTREPLVGRLETVKVIESPSTSTAPICPAKGVSTGVPPPPSKARGASLILPTEISTRAITEVLRVSVAR